ncbi:MAG: hypothetical protein IPL39_16430 [Opitutaceae bacterium]|nr:hypothetical protein [Opitutaceae bacterium]
MSSAPHQPPPRPTLEDLLRFKRAERPSPEFWEEFDRGLRQKQLAALMQRPQGWARVRPVLFRGMRWAVPATAAAAVALVVLQIPGRSKPETQVAALPPRTIPVAESAPPLPVVQVAATAPEQQYDEGSQMAPALAETHTDSLPQSARTEVVQAVEHALPWSAASLAYSEVPPYRVSAVYPSRSVARETRPPNSSWTSRFSEMVRELSAEQSDARVLQLASMDFPVSNQHAVATAQSGALRAGAGGDRSGRTLSDRQLRDLDSRFGVKGTSVSIKF